MKFKIITPEGFKKLPLPGRDEWCADLRANPNLQGYGNLGKPGGPNCCGGRLSLLQGRLGANGNDGSADDNSGLWLSSSNPMYKFIKFPNECYVMSHNLNIKVKAFSELNDVIRLTFPEIAEVIETFFYDDGPLLK